MSLKLASPGKGVSLETFLRENEVMLASLGVFSALVVLSLTLSNGFFREVLASLFVFGMILVWIEVHSKLPKEEASLRLFLFGYVLLWGGLALIGFWLYEFRTMLDLFLFPLTSLLILWFIIGSISPLVKRFALTRNLFGIGVEKKSLWQKMIIIMYAVLMTFLAALTGGTIALGANVFLDGLRKLGM